MAAVLTLSFMVEVFGCLLLVCWLFVVCLLFVVCVAGVVCCCLVLLSSVSRRSVYSLYVAHL